MNTWLGPVGSMVPFRCVSAEDITPAARSKFDTTLGGRVVEQRGPRGRRAWQVALPRSTEPAEAAGLLALLDGAFGPPPWVWLDPWAAVTNLLTPDAALLAPGTWEAVSGSWSRTGALQVPDRTLPASLVVSSGTQSARVGFAVPGRGATALPMTVFTGSVWLRGTSATVRLEGRNGAGVVVSSSPTVARTGTATWQRVSVSWATTFSVASLVLRVDSATGLAGPQITMTPGPVDYAHGEGAAWVSVDGAARSVLTAARSQRMAGVSFTVRELG